MVKYNEFLINEIKLKSLDIKSLFKKMLIQGPLAGYSCAPFREAATLWGQPDFCYSEMLSAQHIFSGAQQRKRYQYKSSKEGLLCV